MLFPPFPPAGELPALTLERLLTSWTLDPVMLIPLAVAGGCYLWGVWTMRRRGDHWSSLRVVFWFAGLLVIFIGVSSAVGVYDRTLFMVPAVQHMVLQMIAPVGLVMAAPMSLALRTLPAAGRRVLLALMHSRAVRTIAHPAVAFGLFAATQFVYYYSPLYLASLRTPWVHQLMHLHFVLIGFLFYWALLSVDPTPFRLRFVFRFMLVVGMAPVHIVLGIPIMLMDDLIAADYYLAMGREWGPSPLRDQQIGGGILWVFGDAAAAALIGAFVRQWSGSDERLARRTDRQLDRVHGSGATMRPWWLAEPGEDVADVSGPQRGG